MNSNSNIDKRSKKEFNQTESVKDSMKKPANNIPPLEIISLKDYTAPKVSPNDIQHHHCIGGHPELGGRWD